MRYDSEMHHPYYSSPALPVLIERARIRVIRLESLQDFDGQVILWQKHAQAVDRPVSLQVPGNIYSKHRAHDR